MRPGLERTSARGRSNHNPTLFRGRCRPPRHAQHQHQRLMASLFGASVAAAYALHRPILPPAVVAAILAEAGSGVKRIVDIACGSGQLTLALAAATPRATVVVGLDASPAQLSFARDADPGGRVLWRQGTATETGEETGAADLLTVAQALHWCVPARPPASPSPPPRPFYVEAARVLRPGGTFAAVSYGLASICAADADGGTPLPAATAVLHAAHDDTLAAYWAPERALVLNGMRGLDPTPGEGFPRVVRRAARMSSAPLTPAAIAGYVASWSATAAAAAAGLDVAREVGAGLEAALGGPAARARLDWPVTLLLAARAA